MIFGLSCVIGVLLVLLACALHMGWRLKLDGEYWLENRETYFARWQEARDERDESRAEASRLSEWAGHLSDLNASYQAALESTRLKLGEANAEIERLRISDRSLQLRSARFSEVLDTLSEIVNAG
jgi:hypothetical protein